MVTEEERVRMRFAASVCKDSQKDARHCAPCTSGTARRKNGETIEFTMYLSGMAVVGHLFAVLRP